MMKQMVVFSGVVRILMVVIILTLLQGYQGSHPDLTYAQTCDANAQFKVDYYYGTGLQGSPFMSTCEEVGWNNKIDSDWGVRGVCERNCPGKGDKDTGLEEYRADDFSVRWTGNFNFEAGTYAFSAVADDGIRVYLDGTPVIDGWDHIQYPTPYQGNIQVSAGWHTVVVEYFEQHSGAIARVNWAQVASPSPTFQIIMMEGLAGTATPTNTPRPTATPHRPETSGGGGGGCALGPAILASIPLAALLKQNLGKR